MEKLSKLTCRGFGARIVLGKSLMGGVGDVEAIFAFCHNDPIF
jgi:hypothetical protein